MNVNAIYAVLASWKKNLANLLSDFFSAEFFWILPSVLLAFSRFSKKFARFARARSVRPIYIVEPELKWSKLLNRKKTGAFFRVLHSRLSAKFSIWFIFLHFPIRFKSLPSITCEAIASKIKIWGCNIFRSWGRPCATLIFERGNLRGTPLEVDDVSGFQMPFPLGQTSAATRCRTRKHIFFSVHPYKPDPITWPIQHKNPTGCAVRTPPPPLLVLARPLRSRGLVACFYIGTPLGDGGQVMYPTLGVLSDVWNRPINVSRKVRIPVLHLDGPCQPVGRLLRWSCMFSSLPGVTSLYYTVETKFLVVFEMGGARSAPGGVPN